MPVVRTTQATATMPWPEGVFSLLFGAGGDSAARGRDGTETRLDLVGVLVLLFHLVEDLLEDEAPAAVVGGAPARQGFLAFVGLELAQVVLEELKLFVAQRAVLDLVALLGPLFR